MTRKRPKRRIVILAALVLAAAALALAAAPRAAAGTYRAVQCHEPLGAGRPDVSYAASSNRYVASAACDGKGLGVSHEPGARRTAAGRFGAWTVTAPAGTAIVRAAARVSAAGADWHAPQVFIALADGVRRMLRGVRGERRHPVSWAGAAGRSLTARLLCSHARDCGPGRTAHVHLRRVALTLRDSAAPSAELAGSLLEPGSRRGAQTLAVAATDTGAGVRTVSLDLNGDPLAARVFDCALAGAVALRLRPCPGTDTARFDLATTAPHFRQGPNRLRACVADYAPRANSNRACTTRTIRVDNLCPLSGTPGAVLHARFRGGGARLATRSDRPAVVAGRLTDDSGTPVSGARVCIASRPRLAASAERVLAAPTTDARGAFAARIPAGPSREIRVAHWPDADAALERRLTLAARAIPRLRLRPHRPLANGERLRFAVRIPGPANSRRRVLVQARAGDRWIRIAGGRTSVAGTWSGGYRFRSTTGTRRYAFRAVIRRQAGYPYESGRSRIARARVVG